jgi:hypothetical protein
VKMPSKRPREDSPEQARERQREQDRHRAEEESRSSGSQKKQSQSTSSPAQQSKEKKIILLKRNQPQSSPPSAAPLSSAPQAAPAHFSLPPPPSSPRDAAPSSVEFKRQFDPSLAAASAGAVVHAGVGRVRTFQAAAGWDQQQKTSVTQATFASQRIVHRSADVAVTFDGAARQTREIVLKGSGGGGHQQQQQARHQDRHGEQLPRKKGKNRH